MTREEYRKAVDAVDFSQDFTQRTLSLLEGRQKETSKMKKIPLKTVLVAAALVAALAVTVSAAVMLLSPSQVAQEYGYDRLAAAFDSGEATMVDRTETVGDYNVTFMGFATGKGLTAAAEDLDGALLDEMTYGVAAVARADGQPLTADDPAPVTFTPLVEGFAPWQVNNWTLGGGYTYFTEGGILYMVFESGTVEPFADHRVYLAAYPGHSLPPNSELFAFGADGSIAFQPGQEGVLFELPLDPAKADPAAVSAMVEPWTAADPHDPADIASDTMQAVEFYTIGEDGNATLQAAEH